MEVEMRRTYLAVCLTTLGALGLAGAAPVLAQGTPDGMTPAEEAVCDIDRGTNRFGLCNAYCEAMDCDSAFPNASAAACEATLGNYTKKSGLVPPCVDACPCLDRNDGFTAAATDSTSAFVFPCLDILATDDNFDPLVIVCAPGDPGFDCTNDGVGNFVAVGQNLQGVNFCGGNLDGQEPAFFGISTLQRLTCTALIETGPFGFGACLPIGP